jgi:hypothetical protein
MLAESDVYDFDRYPNIPNDFITDSITTLDTKYIFKIVLILSHCLYTNDAVTSLPSSNTHPITIIGTGLAENI